MIMNHLGCFNDTKVVCVIINLIIKGIETVSNHSNIYYYGPKYHNKRTTFFKDEACETIKMRAEIIDNVAIKIKNY